MTNRELALLTKRKNKHGKTKRINKKDFRSNFEYQFAVFLRKNETSFQYETLKLPWNKKITSAFCGECKSNNVYQRKIYTPDFILSNGMVIETKGRFTSAMRTKMLAVIEAHTDKDIRMVFMRDNTIKAKRYSSYSNWCKYHGVKFHVVEDPKNPTIPKTWLK